jgi:two-component system cell cycle response regulator
MTAGILIVGDLPLNNQSLQQKLADDYCDVFMANSEEEALNLLQEHHIDLVLLAVATAELDPYQLCTSIKTTPQTSHIPVVMIANNQRLPERIQAFEAGSDDFLSGTAPEMRVIARIRSLLRIKSLFDEIRLRDQTWNKFGIELAEEFQVVQDVAASRVLLLDNDNAHTRLITDTLSKLGIVTTITTEVDNPTSPYDLIIISTLMKDIDGLRICSKFRSTPGTKYTPILIITSENNNEQLIKALDMGVTDYIMTPIDAHELEIHVKTQIRRKKYQDVLLSHYSMVAKMAAVDELTKLYNRRYFDSHINLLVLQANLTQRKKIAVFMIDIDDFKQVNDKYGHLVGDELLKELSRRISVGVRMTDLVARFGGEEFVIALPGLSAHAAEIVAERIRILVGEEPFFSKLLGREIVATISLGVSNRTFGDTPEQLLLRADSALYQAKERGKNRVVLG